MSTSKRVVLCVALLSAIANGLPDRAIREDVDADQIKKLLDEGDSVEGLSDTKGAAVHGKDFDVHEVWTASTDEKRFVANPVTGSGKISLKQDFEEIMNGRVDAQRQLQTAPTCEYVVVSGSTSQTWYGTYSKFGTCHDKPRYKCDDCSSERYIRYINVRAYRGWLVSQLSDCNAFYPGDPQSDVAYAPEPDPTYASVTWGSSSIKVQCRSCIAGYFPKEGRSPCEPCEAGRFSTEGRECSLCAPGTYSDSNGATTCTQCGPGKYSTEGQSKCEQCGDGGDAWKLGNWDPNQRGAGSKEDCNCIRGRTGTNCDQEECAPTTPVVSLGFLVLEGQWPRFVRELSRNDDFVGISAAFRSYDIDGNDRLSIAEARRAIRAGGMAVPLEVTHIWSRDGAELDEDDITITEMIEDELERLGQQKTKEYYERPDDSGNITAMDATYPNPRTMKTQCEAQNEAPPKLTWTVDRDDKVIYQQCVFFNGEALTGADEGLNKEISDGGDCKGEDGHSECSYNFQLPENYQVKSYQDNGVEYEVLPISKHSYCVETKFCDSTPCTNTTAVRNLTIMRCTTGLQYDGTPMDIFPRMLGTQGVALSWLDTSTVATGYRVYKVADLAVPFADDTSARLLREFSTSECGLTHDYLDFRDITTGSEPGIYVGYAVVPLNNSGVEDKEKVGENGFVVTWFGDVYIEVEAEGGGPVEDVTVKLSHLVNGDIDDKYRDFVEERTDTYGEAHLKVRVQDPNWSGLTQHFRVTVEKNSTRANGRQQIHNFEPSSEDVTLRHLGQFNFEFTDTTSRVISGTVSHDGFNSSYFAADCPHLKSEDSGECMCPVDGAQVYIKRASGGEEKVTLNQGKFATAVFEGETVTIGLRMYNGTNGDVPHNFSVTHDAVNATVQHGTAPTFKYTADEDAEVHFLDISTQTLNATYVVGADRTAAKYVNGVPVVAKVERCGWEQPAWAVRGVATFELGAAAVEVRALGDGEVEEAKYYHPPGPLENKFANDCLDITDRDDIIVPLSDPPVFTRGCRAEIPEVAQCNLSAPVQVPGCQTIERPCATMDYDYVDQLPTTRIFEVDLSILGTDMNEPIEFLIASPLCLESVSATAVTTLQSLLTHHGAREYPLGPDEDLLMVPPPPEDEGMYGKACTNDTDAIFREGDAVGFGFELVEREPNCGAVGSFPWDKENFCNGYIDTQPSPDHPIAIRVADGVSKTENSATYDVAGFTHIMTAGAPNPFASFSHELSVKFTREFDAAKILFVRHALVLGVIPEEVPQVWTVATNPTLIFLILHDPPGGGSFTSLTEGSTISTSMAIDGSHAAELEYSWERGGSVGLSKTVRGGIGLGAFVETGVLSVGAKGGFSQSRTPTDVTVSRATSRHFDVGISFSAGISTSSSPYLAGQPSDVIVGGGANLRFISSVEVYATASGDKLCLRGRNTKQFLPEQISTWVMSVYEIEKTIERIGATLADPNGTKLENADESSTYDPRADLAKQIENWQTVLANYRATTLRDQAESVAEQLSQELSSLETNFQSFLDDAVKNGNDAQFAGFLSRGLDKLGEFSFIFHRDTQEMPDAVKDKASEEGVDASVNAEDAAGARLGRYERDVLDRVNDAFNDCVSTVEFVEPGSKQARLCDVYKDIRQRIELKESALFGICDFKDGNPSVEAFCARDRYRSDDPTSKKIGAFGGLFDTTQFITFSGTTGLEFSWDIAESRGQELTSTHDATEADGIGWSFGFGANIGRRRLDSADDRGVPGYAYPSSGRVLAVSKKLLEVTPEALEEKRRRLASHSDASFHSVSSGSSDSSVADHSFAIAEEEAEQGASAHEAETKPSATSNPCRRRLDGVDLSDEERRRLGVTACAGFEGGTSSSFAVSLGRAASKDAEHSRSVSIFLGDGNAQDVFAVKISQDAIYGTPIFTTMGGRSSCVGETGTTRRDSRVTIKKIKHLCSENDPADKGKPICESESDCECKGLEPGKNAIFSVVFQNSSPWVTSVKPLLRVVNGAVTAWASDKYAKNSPETCPAGDPGSLEVRALGNSFDDLRNREGLIIAPLPYGQSEIRLVVSRRDFAPQCFAYEKIKLELISACEDPEWDSNQEVYQYRTSMEKETGDVTVIHPKFVSRPVGKCDVATEDLTPAELPDESVAKNQGTGRWCYSDLNLAVGCTASPATCWTACSEKVTDLKRLEGTAAEVVATCPASFVKAVDDMFKCDVGDLKAVDWEEKTGQCRCQNSCDCAVDNLVMPDGEALTTTHLLTKDVSFPPKKDGKPLACGLYTFTDASKARGPETSKATFDVSWKNEVHGCLYSAASNYNPLATVDDDTCEFAGCKYEAASNYDPKATKDDGKCKFAKASSAQITGSICVSGDVSDAVLDKLKDELREDIAQVLVVAEDQVTITTASGGCETRRRRLEDTSGTKLVYVVKTDSVAGENLRVETSAMMGDLGAIVEEDKAYILDLAACACIENPLVTCPPCPLDKANLANLSWKLFIDLCACIENTLVPCPPGQCPLDALTLTSLGDPELNMLDSPTPEPTSESTPVLGCKYKAATNFNPLATVDDDSCMFATSGCTYQAASNYNSEASVDDGSCIFAPVCKPCSDDTECELDEFCKFKEDGGRRLRFGSIQQEGCCQAR